MIFENPVAGRCRMLCLLLTLIHR